MNYTLTFAAPLNRKRFRDAATCAGWCSWIAYLFVAFENFCRNTHAICMSSFSNRYRHSTNAFEISINFLGTHLISRRNHDVFLFISPRCNCSGGPHICSFRTSKHTSRIREGRNGQIWGPPEQLPFSFFFAVYIFATSASSPLKTEKEFKTFTYGI